MAQEIPTVTLEQAEGIAQVYFGEPKKSRDKYFINLDLQEFGILPVTLKKMYANDNVTIENFNDLFPGLSISASLGKAFKLCVTYLGKRFSAQQVIPKTTVLNYNGRDKTITAVLNKVTHSMEQDLLQTKLGLGAYNILLSIIKEVAIALVVKGNAYEEHRLQGVYRLPNTYEVDSYKQNDVDYGDKVDERVDYSFKPTKNSPNIENYLNML